MIELRFGDDDLERLADLLAERLAERLGPTGAEAPVVYSPATLAAEVGITARAVRAAIDRGELQAKRSGRGWVISAEAVAAWAAPASAAAAARRARAPAARTMHDALGRLDS